MDKEIDFIKRAMKNLSCQIICNYHFYCGTIHGHEIVLFKTNIGKVNAAIGVTVLHQHFKPNYLINIGIAGALRKDMRVGDVVIASKLAYHDVDVTSFDFAYGQVPYMPDTYFPDKTLISHLNKKKYSRKIISGLIVSGDSFVANLDEIERIKSRFPEACAVDMESCAIAQSCHVLQIPFAIIRSISDTADDEARETYDKSAHASADISAKVIIDIIKRINEDYK